MLTETCFLYYNSIKLHFDNKNTYDCFKYNFELRRKFSEDHKQFKLYRVTAERASTVTNDSTDEILYFFATFREKPNAFINMFSDALAVKRFSQYKIFLDCQLYERYRDFLRVILEKYGKKYFKLYFTSIKGKTPEMYYDIVNGVWEPEIFVLHNKLFGAITKTNDELLKREYDIFCNKFYGIVDTNNHLASIVKNTLEEFT